MENSGNSQNRYFAVRSVELEACICHEYPRQHNKCSYHEILKIDPDKRTKAMKAVIQSQELAFEAGKLLLSTRAYTQELDTKRLSKLKGRFEKSDEAVIMEKVVFERAMERNETPLERAKSLSWLHLLAAVPILMSHVATKDVIGAAQVAAIALALMQQKSRRWETLLEPHGLSLWDYELVVRMHQSHAILEMPAILPDAVVTNYAPIMKANAERIYSVQPTNNWNLMFCITMGMYQGNRSQVLREAIKVADDDGDDSISICLRWTLCHAILLGAEGPSFELAEVLSIITNAHAAMEVAEKWTNPKTIVPPETYWPCLGVAARYSAAVKKDPSFGHTRMPAYASSADLDSEKRHVMCAWCDEMCYPLKKCSGCQSVGYCSKKCQIKSWKAGHKQKCKLNSKPDNQCSA
ncbi:hypothetical protein COCOBI_15-1310 [Coccomyxa sp. Obi]|nr:hypothetical protein COCOBI_15-1310 [Coccomyxa sp. Obi]